jgi:hypothetical protein
MLGLRVGMDMMRRCEVVWIRSRVAIQDVADIIGSRLEMRWIWRCRMRIEREILFDMGVDQMATKLNSSKSIIPIIGESVSHRYCSLHVSQVAVYERDLQRSSINFNQQEGGRPEGRIRRLEDA